MIIHVSSVNNMIKDYFSVILTGKIDAVHVNNFVLQYAALHQHCFLGEDVLDIFDWVGLHFTGNKRRGVMCGNSTESPHFLPR